jgi:hypothetical protein
MAFVCRLVSQSQRRPLTEEEVQLLMRATEIDRRLYSEALRIFRDRAKAHGCLQPQAEESVTVRTQARIP